MFNFTSDVKFLVFALRVDKGWLYAKNYKQILWKKLEANFPVQINL